MKGEKSKDCMTEKALQSSKEMAPTVWVIELGSGRGGSHGVIEIFVFRQIHRFFKTTWKYLMLILFWTLITYFKVKTGLSATEVVILDLFVFPDFCL